MTTMSALISPIFALYSIAAFCSADLHSKSVFTDVIELQPFSAKKLDSLNVPENIKYVLFEAHLLGHNVTLSYEYPLYYKNLSSKTSISGSNVGLIKFMDQDSIETFVWLLNPNDFAAKILVFITQHSVNEPIPGGCNMEFPIEISPFLRISDNGIDTRLEYQRASKGYPRNSVEPSCDATKQLITYDVYVYFMDENDFSTAEFEHSLTIMNDVDTIKRYATPVHTYMYNPQTRVLSMTYPRRGAVFNVIANYKGTQVNYVPIASYGCDLNSSVDGCGKLRSLTGKITLTVLGIVGLIVCFRGHKYYYLQTFFFGFIAVSVPTFVLIAKYTDFNPTERDLTIVAAGMIGALASLLFWIAFKSHVLSTLLSGLVLGFLLTATILFTTIGNEDIFRNDVNYWLIIGCGMLLFPILLLPFGNLLSIFSCSIVGSYTSVLAIDRFLYGSLSYIFLNIIKRATFDDIYLASNQVPFQTKDIVLSVVWAVLSLVGAFLQLYESSVASQRVQPEVWNNGPPVERRRRKPSNSQLPPYLRLPPEAEPLLRAQSQRNAVQNLPRYESI